MASVKAELKQGSQPQSTILSLIIKENPNFNLSFGIDNYGAFNSGEIQRNTSVTIIVSQEMAIAFPVNFSYRKEVNKLLLTINYPLILSMVF